MTIGERVKIIRKENGLTMDKFGERVGVTKVAISRIESGVNNLTPQMAKAIAREFGISEEWLKTGEGEMRPATATGAAAKIAAQLGLGEWGTRMLEQYMTLGSEERTLFLVTLKKILVPVISAERQSEIDEKVESYRAELEAQAASEKSSASQTGSTKEA